MYYGWFDCNLNAQYVGVTEIPLSLIVLFCVRFMVNVISFTRKTSTILELLAFSEVLREQGAVVMIKGTLPGNVMG